MVMDMKVMVVCTVSCTKMMENKPQMLTVSIYTITTETGTLKRCSSAGFHTWVTCFSSNMRVRVKTLDIKIVQNVCLHIDFVCGL